MKRHLLKLVAHQPVMENYNQHAYFAKRILLSDASLFNRCNLSFDWLRAPINQNGVKTRLSKINIVAFCSTGGAIETSFHTRTVQNIIQNRIITCVIVSC